jgi:hypothetical protein
VVTQVPELLRRGDAGSGFARRGIVFRMSGLRAAGACGDGVTVWSAEASSYQLVVIGAVDQCHDAWR